MSAALGMRTWKLSDPSVNLALAVMENPGNLALAVMETSGNN